jgi:hypothetical protein
VDACQPFRKSLPLVFRKSLQQNMFFGLVGLGHRSAYHCRLIGRQSTNRSAYPCSMQCIMVVLLSLIAPSLSRSAYHCSLIGRQSMNLSAYPCIIVVLLNRTKD